MSRSMLGQLSNEPQFPVSTLSEAKIEFEQL